MGTNKDNYVQEDFDGTEILACIDGSAVSESVCDFAAWIAKTTERPLKLVHTIKQIHNAAVSDYSGAIGLGSQQALLNELIEVEQTRASLLIKKGQIILQGAKEHVLNSGVKVVETYQHKGSLADSLVELEDDIRVMVIGIRGRNHDIDKGFSSDKTASSENHNRNSEGFGHKLESVIRSVHRPILVVNQKFEPPKRIMLAHDGSDLCKKALKLITTSKLFKNLECHIVHVGDNGENLLDSADKQLTEAGIKVVRRQLSGKVDEALTQYQLEKDIDLTLMGAFSHNRFRDFLLGSFTMKMLELTNRPLLLLR
jgi:nucleotide-binding universal stress UspA family protein